MSVVFISPSMALRSTETSQENFVDFAIKMLTFLWQSPMQLARKHILNKRIAAACNVLLTTLVALDLITTSSSLHITDFVRKCEWLIILFQVSTYLNKTSDIVLSFF